MFLSSFSLYLIKRVIDILIDSGITYFLLFSYYLSVQKGPYGHLNCTKKLDRNEELSI